MTTITLRTLTADDTEQVANVRQFFRNYAAWLGVDLCFQGFDEEMASLPGAYSPPGGRLFYAEINGRPAGCVGVRPFSEGVCEMKRLYVAPEERGQGIGRALLAAGAARLLEAGHRSAAAWALDANLGARAFYAATGAVPGTSQLGWHGDHQVQETAWVWQDLARLLPGGG